MISREAFEFFRDHGGGVVGERALGALHLARAEAYASDQRWRFEWSDDQDADLSWCECADGRVKHHHEVLWCCLRDADGKVLESLGGIVDADRAYGRVIEAELASEAYAKIAAEEKERARIDERRAGYIRMLAHQLDREGWARVDRVLLPRVDSWNSNEGRKAMRWAYLRDSLIWAFEELRRGHALYANRGLVQAAGYAGEVLHDSITSDAFHALKNDIEDILRDKGLAR